MEFEQFINNKFNVTLVYEELGNQNISLDAINDVFDEEVNIHQVEKQLYLLIFPDGSQCQLGNRRMSFNIRSNARDESIKDEFIFSAIEKAVKVNSVLRETSLVAYGFNFDGLAIVEEYDVGAFFREEFMGNAQKIEDISGGSIETFNPSFSIQKQDVKFNLRLKARNPDLTEFHLNAHFEDNDISEQKLKRLENEKFEELKQILLEI